MIKKRLKVRFLLLLATVAAVGIFLTVNGDRFPTLRSWSSPSLMIPRQDGEKIISSLNFSGIEKYLDRLFPSRDTVPIPDMPAIVTAFSSNHFEEGRAMLYNINETLRKRYPMLKVYFFDLGLSKQEAMEIKTICQCTYRPFPFDEFPSHVQILKAYSWKPIVIQLVIREHPFVIWMDASIRYITSNIDGIISNARRKGVLAWQTRRNVIVNHTLELTFKMLNTDPWLYEERPIFHSGFVVLRATPYITHYIVRPWVSCALKLGCMVPLQRPVDFKNCLQLPEKPFGCHRYDQSVLSILIHMLYGEKAPIHSPCKPNCEYLIVCRACKLMGVHKQIKPNVTKRILKKGVTLPAK